MLWVYLQKLNEKTCRIKRYLLFFPQFKKQNHMHICGHNYILAFSIRFLSNFNHKFRVNNLILINFNKLTHLSRL